MDSSQSIRNFQVFIPQSLSMVSNHLGGVAFLQTKAVKKIAPLAQPQVGKIPNRHLGHTRKDMHMDVFDIFGENPKNGSGLVLETCLMLGLSFA
jgi:hypothetical protein